MKFPIPYKCKCCGKEEYLDISDSNLSINHICECGKVRPIFFSKDLTIGLGFLHKSLYEYESNEDYNLSILFSAAAFEVELSNIYFNIRDVGKVPLTPGQTEKELRKYRTIKNKIDEIAKLLYANGLDDFVIVNKLFNDFERYSLEVGNLSESIQVNLFYTRNSIIHSGRYGYTDSEAMKCLNIASLGISTFRMMEDEYKK